MSDGGFLSEEEEAQERIARIRSGMVGNESEAPAAGPRSRAGTGAASTPPPPAAPAAQKAERSGPPMALLIIGGLLALGVLVVGAILLISALTGGGGPGGLFAEPTPTPAPTATPTMTPEPTATPTPTPAPTRPAPNLALPPLTCVFQSGQSCQEYCEDPENRQECNSARDFIRAQNADPEFWFQCLADPAGENQGNPSQCLVAAWRVRNP